EAQRELDRARQQAEEELAREQLAKVQEQLKALQERQASLIAERDRLQREAEQRGAWTSNLLKGLGGLKDAQENLAQETNSGADPKLEDAIVFGSIWRKAAKAMEEAADHIAERKDELLRKPQDIAPDEELVRLQGEALRRLKQLLDALKEEALARQAGGGGGGQ